MTKYVKKLHAHNDQYYECIQANKIAYPQYTQYGMYPGQYLATHHNILKIECIQDSTLPPTTIYSIRNVSKIVPHLPPQYTQYWMYPGQYLLPQYTQYWLYPGQYLNSYHNIHNIECIQDSTLPPTIIYSILNVSTQIHKHLNNKSQ